jgi:hypothetical protein
MNRPSEARIAEALDTLDAYVPRNCNQSRAVGVLRQALKPRTVWSSKEVADALGVDPSNLQPGGMRGFELLAKPFQRLPRPSATIPDKVMRLWWADEVLEHPKAPRAGQTWKDATRSFYIVRVVPERVTLRSVDGFDTAASFRALRERYQQVERGGSDG